MKYRTRTLAAEMSRVVAHFFAVLVAGSRRSGKATLLLFLVKYKFGASKDFVSRMTIRSLPDEVSRRMTKGAMCATQLKELLRHA